MTAGDVTASDGKVLPGSLRAVLLHHSVDVPSVPWFPSVVVRRRLTTLHVQGTQFLTFKRRDLEQREDASPPFCFLFVSVTVFGLNGNRKSWTDCVYTLSSARGDACHGANALCLALCVAQLYR